MRIGSDSITVHTFHELSQEKSPSNLEIISVGPPLRQTARRPVHPRRSGLAEAGASIADSTCAPVRRQPSPRWRTRGDRESSTPLRPDGAANCRRIRFDRTEILIPSVLRAEKRATASTPHSCRTRDGYPSCWVCRVSRSSPVLTRERASPEKTNAYCIGDHASVMVHGRVLALIGHFRSSGVAAVGGSVACKRRKRGLPAPGMTEERQSPAPSYKR